MGSYNLTEAEVQSDSSSSLPQKNMTLAEKVEHIRGELRNVVKEGNKAAVLNSIIKQEGNFGITFKEIKDILLKI